MKLPILELKGIGSINNNKKHLFKLKRIKTIANFFLLQKHNISSIFSENKLKSEILPKENHFSQRYNNNVINNSKKIKLTELIKFKNAFFNRNKNRNNNDNLNSYNCKSSNRITLNDISTEEESAKNNNYEKYIKNRLNSFKIKKEISSFLYSSPEKQKRLINFLSKKFNKEYNNDVSTSVNLDKGNIRNVNLIKIKKRLINIKENDINELDESIIQEDNDQDEDKTNLKEFSLLSLYIGNKKEKIQNKVKYMRDNKNKYIESWDNNLLKNILPKNIKSEPELNIKNIKNYNNKYKDYSFRRRKIEPFFQLGMNSFNRNSVNNNMMNRYKYQYQYNFENNKKNKEFRNNHYLYNSKKLARSYSNL